MQNLPRPLTEEQAAEEVIDQYDLLKKLDLAERREESKMTRKARELMQYEDVTLEEAKITRTDLSSIEGEIETTIDLEALKNDEVQFAA